MKYGSKVVILGPAYPLRGGGISTFNERLAKEFMDSGFDTVIYTFSYQYPSILFPGKSQYSTEPAPERLIIKVKINSINPFNWVKVGKELQRLEPALIVVRYWLPFMAPCLGTILRIARKNMVTKVICIADNVLPHEKRPGDKMLTSYFIKAVDAFITMSEKVLTDLKSFAPAKPALLVPHPLYDNFGAAVSKQEARSRLGIAEGARVILFFGFIRKYKGLDLLLQAFKKVVLRQKIPNLKLMIAGEFYDDEKNYRDWFNDPAIRDHLILKTDFIPNSEVRNFFCASDCVVQPYRSATQSGVTPLAYHFETPMIVTNVGGLPSMVLYGKTGLVSQPEADDLALKIEEFFRTGPEYFLPHLREEKKKYSWGKLLAAIDNLAGPLII